MKTLILLFCLLSPLAHADTTILFGTGSDEDSSVKKGIGYFQIEKPVFSIEIITELNELNVGFEYISNQTKLIKFGFKF